MSKFQIITLGIFILCIVGGAASFALYKGKPSNASLPAITIWGTFPASVFNQYVTEINNNQAQRMTVKYIQKNQDDFTREFVNALSIGQGPDAILVSADMILPQENKLLKIPYNMLSERSFRDSYIQEANVYLTREGVLAIPFVIDPLVMYWNRDIYNSAGIATYPRYWEEFVGTLLKPGIVQKLTQKDDNNNLKKMAIAMGDFSNITNAREILGSLILQTGNPVTTATDLGYTQSTIQSSSYPINPALQFFTQFANSTDVNYSWNRGITNDKTVFLSGSLSTYFGFASEMLELRAKNPNINFDAAPLPQIKTGGIKTVYGKMYGFSLVRASPNVNTAYQVISSITSPQYLQDLSKTMTLPTVRTDVIALGSSDPYITIFNQSALISKTWLDVDPITSRQIFGTLVQSITSGKKTFQQGIRDASNQYDLLLKQAGQ